MRTAIMQMLGRRLRRNLREREDIALRPVSERVAHFLIANACVRQGPGAKVLVDGRGATVKGCEAGYYVGATVIDYVTPDMRSRSPSLPISEASEAPAARFARYSSIVRGCHGG